MKIDQSVPSRSVPFIFDMRWRPKGETLAAVVSYLLVVFGLYTAFQIFTTERVAINFITFGPITLAVLGVFIPVIYTTAVRHRTLADIGVTTQRILPSLLLSVLLGLDTYYNTLGNLNVIWNRQLVPLVAMSIAVGLFEAVFFRGWLQLRFEDAFGIVPGLILGALCYSLYHIGYGMEVDELLFLFGLGMTFGAFFRLTKNIFVLWPFYTPIGGLYTNISDGLQMPFEATYGFLLTLGLIALAITIGAVIQRKASN